MKKSTAHLVVGIFDVAAIIGLLLFIHTCDLLLESLIHQKPVVLDTGRAYLLLLLVMPLLHGYSLIEFFLPSVFNTWRRWLNIFLIGFFVALLLATFTVNQWLLAKIEAGGYQKCEPASVRISKYTKSTYALVYEDCRPTKK
jgi:hypothetical protein